MEISVSEWERGIDKEIWHKTFNRWDRNEDIEGDIIYIKHMLVSERKNK